MKPCERCGQPAKRGEKYCPECRKVILQEMRDSGYLRFIPTKAYKYRSSDSMENTRETKYGARE
jgi:predicted amidophosphoribosyltransferase